MTPVKVAKQGDATHIVLGSGNKALCGAYARGTTNVDVSDGTKSPVSDDACYRCFVKYERSWNNLR